MKKSIILATLTLTALVGCRKEYLNVDPIDQYVYYNFPSNQSQVEQAVVACYRQAFPIANNYLWLWAIF